MKLCDECKTQVLELLDLRIRRMLAVAHEDVAESNLEEDSEEANERIGHTQAECFHLMEIKRIINGENTCGVYDDYGPPLTISGPLFGR